MKVHHLRSSRFSSLFPSLLGILVFAICVSVHAIPLTSVGNVYHTGQLTGSAGTGSTEQRWTLSGTDVGSMFTDFASNIFTVFGDSFAYDNGLGGGGIDWRNNVLAVSSDADPSNGLNIDSMISDTENHAKLIIPPDPGDYTLIPNSGVSINDKLYIQYMRILQWGNPGQWTVNGSGIAVSSDHGQTWTKNNLWGGSSSFIESAMIRNGGYVYIFGSPAGRFGGVKLARVPEASILTLSAYRYWTGSTWSTSESAGALIVPAPVGEVSVAFNSYLGQFMMLYLNSNNGNVQIRTATTLTGPWSAPVNVVSGATYPGLYAPMLNPNFSSGQEIYFNLSIWNPYNVYVVHATLNPSTISMGPFNLPGRVEAENFREGGSGIGYFDTTAGNAGGGYRSGDVDMLWNDNEDAYQVGWVDNGEWLSYKVNVTKAGAYKFRMKYASGGAGCTVQVDTLGGNPVYVPATAIGGTGSYQNFCVWEPTNVFNLNAGQQFIDLYFPFGGSDVTWFEVYPAYSGSTYRINSGGGSYTDPSGKTWSADAFVTGGSAGSVGVSITNTLDQPLYNSERFGNFTYAFPVSNGAYKVKLKFAEYYWNSVGQRRFNVNIQGGQRLFNYDIIARAGGQNIAKDEIFDVYVENGLLDIDFLTGSADQPKVSAIEITPADPNLYANHLVPGHIEAEEFRPGGENVGYHDTTSGNAGAAFRGTDVDIRAKAAGGYQVGWVDSGEWLSYSINVTKAGTYKFRLRYASGGSGGTVQVDTPGGQTVYVPATAIGGTGGWDTFATWAPTNTFTLNAGPQIINLYFPVGGCDLDYFELYQ